MKTNESRLALAAVALSALAPASHAQEPAPAPSEAPQVLAAPQPSQAPQVLATPAPIALAQAPDAAPSPQQVADAKSQQQTDIEALRAEVDKLKEQQKEIDALRAEIAALKGATPGATPGTPGTGTNTIGGANASSTSAGAAPSTSGNAPAPAARKWYDTISVRGYTQFRYNRLFETNPNLRNEQGDRSIGDNGGFFLRRIRLIFSGQLSDRVSFYLQPDFASQASSTSLNFGQLRDAYFDIGLNKNNEFRLRLGQSKVPFGFENLQSSQNRLPLDRSDAINSAFANERDIGVFLMWAPDKIRKRFASLVSEGLKGSGDYGVFAIGGFNGQTANRPELNDGKHVVARLTYPFAIGSQIFEPHVQAYRGRFVIPTDQTTARIGIASDRTYGDRRVAAGFTLYPRPFGLQAEYNVGRGPEFNPATDAIESQSLKGGYILASYLTKIKSHTLIPFVRYHLYDGGKKQELDARSYRVSEYEIGLEWQPSRAFELTAQYTIAGRRFEDFARQDNFQRGRLLRLQGQVNY